MIAAIDTYGLLALYVKRGTIKSADFCQFLVEVKQNVASRREYGIQDSLLFFDNATVHTSASTRHQIGLLGLRAMTNCPYTPELNPAEGFIL